MLNCALLAVAGAGLAAQQAVPIPPPPGQAASSPIGQATSNPALPGQRGPNQVGPAHPAPRLGPDPTIRYFISAEPNPKFVRVVVGVSRIVMVAAGGDRVIFRAKPAQRVDLGDLARPDDLRYRFLARDVIPNGVYDALRVELDGRLTVTPQGADKALDCELTDTRYGFKMLTVEFPAPQRFEANRNVVLDFDLGKWSLRGTQVAVATVTDPETDRISQLGLVARGKVRADSIDPQSPVTLSGFVTGPIGRRNSPLTGMRQEGWILPVKFGPVRPRRGDIVQITGAFDLAADAFTPTKTTWLRGSPPLPEPPKPLPKPATGKKSVTSNLQIHCRGCGKFHPRQNSRWSAATLSSSRRLTCTITSLRRGW